MSATQSPSADRVVDRQPGGLERGADLGFAIDEDPGRHERPARPQLVPQGAGQRHEDAGDQVGEDDVEGRLAAREAAGPGTDAPREPVPAGVRHGRLDGDRVGVDAEGFGRAELHGRDREDARAAADIEDPCPVDAAVVRDRFERGQAQAGRRVEPGPEGHARVEGEDDVVGLASMPPPGRTDDEAPTDAHHREVRLPGLGPVLLVHDPGPQLADGPQPERLEVAERFGGRRRGGLGRGRVARGHVPADDGRSARIDPRSEPFVDQVERGLHGRAAARHPAEDLADRLDRFDVRLDRELEPCPGLGRLSLVARHLQAELLADPAPSDRLAGVLGVRLERLALLLAELRRDDDIDQDMEVAA